jgi:two-component system, cell cycle sensor histidine kinase and response regulator CckA
VRADHGQLEQVITNLVLNARDAMPEGGTVRIGTRVLGDTVQLSVTDEGTGMAEPTRARLFEPFFTTKEPGKGTGLGLAVVHGIVSQSGGTIAVESAPGRGTSFEISFPTAPADLEPDGVEIAASDGGTETVLVVEDEPDVRELVRRMLELEGYAVVTAASGAEALRLFEQGGPIDVLVTDIVMPGLSGRDLAMELRSRAPGLRIVLMSGFAEDAGALDELLAGGAVFVEKPFTSRTLVTEVRSVLDAAAV